jgi:tetratricopeptide (TPR) repeat protein
VGQIDASKNSSNKAEERAKKSKGNLECFNHCFALLCSNEDQDQDQNRMETFIRNLDCLNLTDERRTQLLIRALQVFTGTLTDKDERVFYTVVCDFAGVMASQDKHGLAASVLEWILLITDNTHEPSFAFHVIIDCLYSTLGENKYHKYMVFFKQFAEAVDYKTPCLSFCLFVSSRLLVAVESQDSMLDRLKELASILHHKQMVLEELQVWLVATKQLQGVELALALDALGVLLYKMNKTTCVMVHRKALYTALLHGVVDGKIAGVEETMFTDHLAVSLLKYGDADEARQLFRDLIPRYDTSSDPRTKRRLVRALMGVGDYDKALEVARSLKNVVQMKKLAKVFFDRGEYQKALSTFRGCFHLSQINKMTPEVIKDFHEAVKVVEARVWAQDDSN